MLGWQLIQGASRARRGLPLRKEPAARGLAAGTVRDYLKPATRAACSRMTRALSVSESPAGEPL